MIPYSGTPLVGSSQGKVWGKTQLVFAWNNVEVHLLDTHSGYRCSRHSHEHKWNRFLVLSGAVKVTVWRESGTADVSELVTGGITDVPPGVEHMFEVVNCSRMLEFYWVQLDPDDIHRIDEGGKIN